MSKILKNYTVSPIVINDTGITIQVAPDYTIPTEDYTLWAASSNIITQITSGDVIVNDGVEDMSAVDAINYLSYPDDAFNVRFESEPERSNNFSARNVQEAIEESKANIEGKTTALPSFMNNGITKDKWLALDGSMSPSNELPAVIAFGSSIASLVFINKNDDSDTDIEIYINGVLDFTWEVRNKRWAYKTNALTAITFASGDRISCFAKSVASGTGVDPSSVVLDVVVRSTSSVTGEDGASTL